MWRHGPLRAPSYRTAWYHGARRGQHCGITPPWRPAVWRQGPLRAPHVSSPSNMPLLIHSAPRAIYHRAPRPCATGSSLPPLLHSDGGPLADTLWTSGLLVPNVYKVSACALGAFPAAAGPAIPQRWPRGGARDAALLAAAGTVIPHCWPLRAPNHGKMEFPKSR